MLNDYRVKKHNKAEKEESLETAQTTKNNATARAKLAKDSTSVKAFLTPNNIIEINA